MSSISSALLDLKQLDQMAHAASPVHTLHPVAKVLTVLVFTVCVVSFSRYELSALFPFFLFPMVILARSSLPPLFIAKKVALFLPLMLLIGIFNPLFDRAPLLQIGQLAISGGWISFFSIVTRSVLTVSCAFILIGTTGYTAVCQALGRLGIPQVFTTQLLFLYRYIFVLAEETYRAALARELRSCGTRGQGIESYSSLIGALLLRTWGRAERIHGAMLARGFSGQFHAENSSHFSSSDVYFVAVWSGLFMIFRSTNISLLIGDGVARFFL